MTIYLQWINGVCVGFEFDFPGKALMLDLFILSVRLELNK